MRFSSRSMGVLTPKRAKKLKRRNENRARKVAGEVRRYQDRQGVHFPNRRVALPVDHGRIEKFDY